MATGGGRAPKAPLLGDECSRALIPDTHFPLSFRGDSFFFSSRRRHTMSLRDWSSDVCSSDLVMSGVNPQGVQVTGFKVPSAEELDHDYLWRYARHLPARGDIGIFNRSHYEEVLVVRVHPENLDRQRLPAGAKRKGIWERRYREINDWERYLTDNGFTLVKLFLNLSKEEQRTRFLKRIDLPEKNWKFSAADVRERARWDDYQKAFSEMLSATSTPWAPWYVIPADRKWFARVCAAAAIVHTLMEID